MEECVIKYKDNFYLKTEVGYKKIILTTDPQLIEQGIQAIDDEFLEWFIKNPNCEEVEVYELNGKLFAEPIMPKLESKPETIEETAEKLYPVHINPILDKYNDGVTNVIGKEDINEDCREIFIAGAKWQQKRSYSEEEVLKLLLDSEEYTSRFNNRTNLTSWFENNKKK